MSMSYISNTLRNITSQADLTHLSENAARIECLSLGTSLKDFSLPLVEKIILKRDYLTLSLFLWLVHPFES